MKTAGFNRALLRSAIAAWREFVWISAGQLVGALGAIVGVRFITSFLPPAAYGEFALAFATATLGFQVIIGPLVNAFERFYGASSDAGQTHGFFRAARRLTARASILILILALLTIGGLVLFGQTQWIPLAVASAAYALFSGWEAVLDGVQNAARQRGIVALHQVLRQWLRPVLAVLFLSTIAATSATTMGAYALASIAVLCSQFWFFERNQRALSASDLDTAGSQLESRLVAYATPFALWGVFAWVQVSSDRWALQSFGSSFDVGLYAIVTQLGAYPLTLLGAMLSQVAAPIVFAHAGEGSDLERVTTAISACGALSVAIVFGTFVLAVGALVAHRQLFALLVGVQYQSASSLLPVAVLSSGVFVAGQMLSLMPMALGRSEALLGPKIWTALLAVALNAAGAWLFGTVGVLWAGVVFASCYAGWVALTSASLLNARRMSLSRAPLP